MDPNSFWLDQQARGARGDALERSFPCETAHDGVAFYPDEVAHRCLKCGADKPPWVQRRLQAAYRADYGTMLVRSLNTRLPLCRRCESRWGLALPIVLLGVASPVLIIAAGVFLGVHLSLPDSAFAVIALLALLAPFPLIGLGRRWSLRVKNIEADTMIELRGVHSDVRADIVAYQRPPRQRGA